MRYIGLVGANDNWIAVQASGEIWHSSDLITWKKQVGTSREIFGFGNNVESAAYHKGVFYVSGRFYDKNRTGQNIVATSRDGLTWNIAYKGLVSPGVGVVKSVGDKIYYFGYYGLLYSSIDGVSWANEPTGLGDEPRVVDVAESPTVIGALATTNNSARVVLKKGAQATWSPAIEISKGIMWGLAYGAGRWIAVGTEGKVLTSVDGEQWTSVNAGTTANLLNIRFLDGSFHATDDRGFVHKSATGQSWESQKLPGQASGWQLTTGLTSSATTRAVARDDGIATSNDGVTWSLRRFTEFYAYSVWFLRDRFFMCASETRIPITSTNPFLNP